MKLTARIPSSEGIWRTGFDATAAATAGLPRAASTDTARCPWHWIRYDGAGQHFLDHGATLQQSTERGRRFSQGVPDLLIHNTCAAIHLRLERKLERKRA
jgi:hypothetical protein